MFSFETLEQGHSPASRPPSGPSGRRGSKDVSNPSRFANTCDALGVPASTLDACDTCCPNRTNASLSPPRRRAFSTASVSSPFRHYRLSSLLSPSPSLSINQSSSLISTSIAIDTQFTLIKAISFNVVSSATGLRLNLDFEGSVFLIGRASCSDTQCSTWFEYTHMT